MTAADTSAEAVERLAARADACELLYDDPVAATLRALAAERDRLREALTKADAAVNAAYAQAHAEWHGHDKTAAKHDAVVMAWRQQKRAALEARDHA